ncbi:hypothetical protein [Noviherbaspirillum sp.]|uniref:hypothetical protein n=1 Tax=Noviherbaspirillum sp. TaxID=1926288 RepID=UPI002B49E25E|nr:hypothetical protein [Noviherbaspirillum sp.]HJV83254.1 hypothetical protein [Noviherbaspirillum sp.]
MPSLARISSEPRDRRTAAKRTARGDYFDVEPEVDDPVEPLVPELLEVPEVPDMSVEPLDDDEPGVGVVGRGVPELLLGLGEFGEELDEPGLVLDVPLAPEP